MKYPSIFTNGFFDQNFQSFLLKGLAYYMCTRIIFKAFSEGISYRGRILNSDSICLHRIATKRYSWYPIFKMYVPVFKNKMGKKKVHICSFQSFFVLLIYLFPSYALLTYYKTSHTLRSPRTAHAVFSLQSSSL